MQWNLASNTFRYISFTACFGIACWAFADPINAAKTISTIDVDQQMADFSTLITALSAPTMPPALQASVGFIDTDHIKNTIVVLVRIFSTLILLASGGILSDIPFALMISYATATGFMFAIISVDRFVILKNWFGYTYLIFACVTPLTIVTLNTVRSNRASIP